MSSGGHANEVQWSIFDFVYHGPWWKNRRLLILNLFLFIPLVTSVVNGLDSSLVNGLQILPEWRDYFNNPQGKTLGLISSAQFLGNLSALPFTPYASDILGRKAALFYGSLIMCAGVGLQAASWSVPMFIGSRLMIGFGLSFCQNASPLLLIEISYPTQRGKITSLYNSCWYLGSIISAWVCYGAFTHGKGSQWTWRVPILVQAALPVIQLLSVWLMPESPRWLVSKGREGAAAAVLAKYHSQIENVQDPLVMFEMAQIRHAIRMEEEISRTTSYLSLFTTPGNRRRMRVILGIAVFSQWSGNGLVSYYINLVLDGVGIKDPATQSIVNGCLQIFNLFVAVGATMLIDRAGRRQLFLISNSGMLVAFTCWTVTTALYRQNNNVQAAKATIPLIFVFYFFYDLAYTPVLIAYALEILPYRARAKGFAIMNLTMMATIAFNQFVNPWAIKRIGWWYYIFYCGWLVVELIFIIFFVVETRGRTLEETGALFDGQEQQHDLTAMGGQAAHMSMRFSRAISFTSKNESEVPVRKAHYELKSRYRISDSSTSAAGSDLAGRAL